MTEPRLKRVLRAGIEAQANRADTPLDDDTIRLILDAMARGEPDKACAQATRWCDLNNGNKNACRNGGEAMWKALTARVFGDGAPTLDASAHDNFYALCAAHHPLALQSAQEWAAKKGMTMEGMQGDDAPKEKTWNRLIVAISGALIHIDKGGKDTPEGCVRLATMMVSMFRDFFGEVIEPARGRPKLVTSHLYYLADEDFVYKMLEGTDDEVDAALKLLAEYANNYNDIEDIDGRRGYNPRKVPLLEKLYKADKQYLEKDDPRKVHVIRVWNGLMDWRGAVKLNKNKRNTANYARALIRTGANDDLVDTVKFQRFCALVVDEGGGVFDESVATLAASVLCNIGKALDYEKRMEPLYANGSDTESEDDASGSDTEPDDD